MKVEICKREDIPTEKHETHKEAYASFSAIPNVIKTLKRLVLSFDEKGTLRDAGYSTVRQGWIDSYKGECFCRVQIEDMVLFFHVKGETPNGNAHHVTRSGRLVFTCKYAEVLPIWRERE